MTRKRKSEVIVNESVNTEEPKPFTLAFPVTFHEVASVIQSADSNKLKEMIETKRITDINMEERFHPFRNLLIAACDAGSIECVKVLLDNDIDMTDLIQITTILRSICLRGDTIMLKLLLKRGLEIDDDLIFLCFESAAITTNNHIADILFEHIVDVNYHDEDGDSFLRRVCKAGNVCLATKLLQKGADRDKASGRYGDSLLIATTNGLTEVVKLLLSWDAQGVRVPSSSLKIALKAASYLGLSDIVHILVEYGVEAEVLPDALRQSASRNHVNVADYLINNGADFNTVTPNERSTLYVACNLGHLVLVQLLLSRGADPNLIDGRGELPLRAALFYPEIAKALLEAGADPNQRFATGNTALLNVVRSDHRISLETLTTLLLYKANPNLAHTTRRDRFNDRCCHSPSGHGQAAARADVD